MNRVTQFSLDNRERIGGNVGKLSQIDRLLTETVSNLENNTDAIEYLESAIYSPWLEILPILTPTIPRQDFTAVEGFFTSPFSITVNFAHPWQIIRHYTIENSDLLTFDSTDSEVEQIILNKLNQEYPSSYSENQTIEAYTITFTDYYHYNLELYSGKPKFKNNDAPFTRTDEWHLNYCTIPGNPESIYSTVLSGTRFGNALNVRNNEFFPKDGILDKRVGYPCSVHNFLLN